MTIEVVTADSPAAVSQFINLPFEIYRNFPLWVPNLRSQDQELLDPERHPFWQTARRQLFLAFEDGRPVGRIVAIVDDKYNSYSSEKCGAFGFFECEDNQEAATALLDRSREWLASEGCAFMRGPLNPSANYTCGMLVDGFEHAPALMMPWNPAYYPVLLENWQMRKEQDLFAYVIDRENLAVPEFLRKEIARIKADGRFTCRSSSRKTLADDIRAMLAIYQAAWADNWGFSPLSKAEAENHVRELKGILDPAFFVLFFDGDKPVAGMVALPDMNPLLRRLNGRLGLATPWHYFRSRKEIQAGMRIMLFGILPEYRLHGLPLLLLDYMLTKCASKEDLKWVEGSWILEDNYAMDDLMEDFSGQLKKRYRIYRRELAPC